MKAKSRSQSARLLFCTLLLMASACRKSQAPAASVAPQNSTVLTTTPTPPDNTQKQSFLFTLPDEGIVLMQSPELKWGKGTLQVDLAKNFIRQNVNEKALPPEIRQFKGKRFNAMNFAGQKICETEITGFSLVYKSSEDGYELNAAPNANEPQKSAAQTIWENGPGPGFFLIGKTKDPACIGDWARSADLPLPQSLILEEPSPELAKFALREFKALLAYQEIQQEFVTAEENQNTPVVGPWENHLDAKPQILLLRFPAPHPSWLFVSAQSGAGCGSFEGSLWALWEMQTDAPGTPLRLLNTPNKNAFNVSTKPVGVINLNGNDSLEMLFGTAGVEKVLYDFETVEGIQFAQYGCGC